MDRPDREGTNRGRIHEVRLTVPFHDLDPMHMVWHGNYLKYFDIARFGLFLDGGIDLYRYSTETGTLFPITKSSTKYIASLRHGDAFLCRAAARDANVKIVVDFEVERVSDGVICARGRGEQVAVKMPEMETLFEIPADIRRALGF